MDFTPLPIDGAYEIIPRVFRDARGSFLAAYDALEFSAKGLVTDWVLDNQSGNVHKGTLRGLHFQVPPYSQTKLVRAVVGRALDVIVDLRISSLTYLTAVGLELDGERGNMIYVPKGCAHAYLTLTDNCLISYKVDATYAPAYEGGLRWNDPDIGFQWPLETPPILSEKDTKWPMLKDWNNPF